MVDVGDQGPPATQRYGLFRSIGRFYGRYFDFVGRSSRAEFWSVLVYMMIVSTITLVVDNALGTLITVANQPTYYGWVTLAVTCLHAIPNLALTVRRLHDTGKSGWRIFYSLIPLVGPILLLVWYCTRSRPGPNKFGPNPYGLAQRHAVDSGSNADLDRLERLVALRDKGVLSPQEFEAQKAAALRVP